MACRPIYKVSNKKDHFVDEIQVDFEWVPGMALIQKQKCIKSFHSKIYEDYAESKILEISSKSLINLGVKLSAFNLSISLNNSKITVETFFQGSKCFEKDGPFHERFKLLDSASARAFFKNKEFGNLVCFKTMKNKKWDLYPKTMYYDWIYINFLNKNKDLASSILDFNTFTDIEFNPKKSINCQARAAALYVSFYKKGILEDMLNQDSYKKEMIRVEQLKNNMFNFDSE